MVGLLAVREFDAHVEFIVDVLGKVLSGMEAVDRIAETKTDIYNDRPVQKQVMKKVTVDTFGESYPEPEKL